VYHARGYNVVTVQLPEQELNGGVVRLNVIQARLSRLTVSGNRYYSEQNIRAGLPTLQPGQTPNLPRSRPTSGWPTRTRPRSSS
jgi:hemolysin activation/secretion protein